MLERLSKKILLSLTILSLISFTNIEAAQRIIEADGEYNASIDLDESFSVSRDKARIAAMRNASEQASVYVKAVSVAVDKVIEKDVVEMISANVLQLKGEPIINMQTSSDGKTICFRCHVTVLVDDDNISEQLRRDRNSLNESTRQLKDLENERDRLSAQLDSLKRELDSATSENERQRIREEVQKNDNSFVAMQYLENGNKFLTTGAYIGNRSLIAGKYDEAIANYTKAIELDPNFAGAYCNRAIAYHQLKKYDLAIADFSKAIELKPNFAMGYCLRESSYRTLGRNDLAEEDRKMWLKIDPAGSFKNGARFVTVGDSRMG